MHLIKDENGNLIQHGHEHVHEHTHEHTHADGVTHSHAHTHESGGEHAHSHGEGCQEHTHEHCGSCQEGDCKKETIALLTYMLRTMSITHRNLTRWRKIWTRWGWQLLQKPSAMQLLTSRKATCVWDLP